MKKTLTIREIATIGLFTALTAILAQISLEEDKLCGTNPNKK